MTFVSVLEDYAASSLFRQNPHTRQKGYRSALVARAHHSKAILLPMSAETCRLFQIVGPL
jgi:hypothetical protein